MRIANYPVYLLFGMSPILLAAKKSDPTTNWLTIFQDLLLIAGLVAAAVVVDRLVLGLAWKYLEQQLILPRPKPQQAWITVILKLLRQASRIILWIAVLTTILRLSQAFQPLEQPLFNFLGTLHQEIVALFNRPLFELGRNKISLGFLVLLIALSVTVFFLSHWLSEWFKQSILRGLQVERGAPGNDYPQH